MRPNEFSSLSWFSFVVLLGCSSEVQVDAGGGGTGGFGDGGSGSGGSGVGGQGGDPNAPTLCEQTCEFPVCATPNCVKYCNAVEKNCLEELNASLECGIPYFDDVCDTPADVCVAETAAVNSCLAKHSPTLCSSTSFTGGGSSCGSTGQCLNGQAASIECEQDEDFGFSCRCFVDEVELGTCQDTAEVGCLMQDSCCVQFY